MSIDTTFTFSEILDLVLGIRNFHHVELRMLIVVLHDADSTNALKQHQMEVDASERWVDLASVKLKQRLTLNTSTRTNTFGSSRLTENSEGTQAAMVSISCCRVSVL